MEKQKQYREDLLEWCNNIYFHWKVIKPGFSKVFDLQSLEEWEKSCRELKEKLQTELKVDFDDYQTAKILSEQLEQLHGEAIAYQEKIEVESKRSIETEEQKQYREDLLEWCNNIYFHWEKMKPGFSKVFDLKSLEEWERSCLELKEKLQAELVLNDNDYQTASSLYEQWEQLYGEAFAYQKEIVM